MSDRTEEEEELLIRREARRMQVRPDRMESLLSTHGFLLTYTNRSEGINSIKFLRPTPDRPGLFDGVHVRGESPSFVVLQTIVPGEAISRVTWAHEYVSAKRFGYPRDFVSVATPREAKLFEQRFAAMVPKFFEDFWLREGRQIYDRALPSFEGAERILQQLQATESLPETLGRLQSIATPEQRTQAMDYLNSQTLHTYNLQQFRIVSEIAALALFKYWELPGSFVQIYQRHQRTWTAEDIDAHFRFHIIASRLARAPGWPMIDPLVPNRHDLYDNPTPWREGKPSRVAELIDEHLEATKHFCGCGKALYYKEHSLSKSKPPTATILVRCASGHHETIEMKGWMDA
jgi:hypothetical protein